LAVGCWLLAVGCWLLAVGCWLLAVGCWLLAVGCWLLDRILQCYKKMCDPIDVVVTWVDSSCPQWKALREIYAKTEPDCYFTPPECPDSEVDLCISLILKHLPWLRQLFLVTMRPQSPTCICRPGFEKVKVVHHDEFMPVDCLPTFDSKAIEAHLWKIPDLSERFVYFNDDIYVLREMQISAFFADQKPKVWVSKVPPKEWKALSSPYRKSWFNLTLLFPGAKLLHHAPQSMTKSIMECASLYFGEAWVRTCMSRVRSCYGIPAIGACVNLAIREHHAIVDKIPTTLFKEAVVKPATVRVLLSKDAAFLCVNRQPFDKTRVFCDEMRRCLF
jgi:hypothetical protein